MKRQAHQGLERRKGTDREAKLQKQEGRRMLPKGVDVLKPCKWNFEKPLEQRADAEREWVGTPVWVLQQGSRWPGRKLTWAAWPRAAITKSS